MLNFIQVYWFLELLDVDNLWSYKITTTVASTNVETPTYSE